jgi:hypothetical protein
MQRQTERRWSCQTRQWETVELPLNHEAFGQWDRDLERLERRQWERDGWNLARASRQRF